MNLHHIHFIQRTRIMLDAIDGLPLAELAPTVLLIPLQLVGDAVRLGIETPGPVMRAFEALPEDAVRTALRALCEEVATWGLPSDPVADADGYAWALRRRDEAESVIVGARRAMIARQVLADSFEEVRRLRALLEVMDFTCGGKAGRREARRALGERDLLVKRGSWVAALGARTHVPGGI